MDLPLIGTVDLTPSGLFLIFAALVAVGYVGWQVVGARRAAARASDAEEGAPAEAATVADVTVENGADAYVADDADEPGPNAGA